MHVIYNLTLWQQDDEIFGDKANSFLFHRLWNPNTGIFGHSEFASYDANISAIQVASSSYRIWISCGNRNFRQVRGNLLGIGE